MSPAVAEAVAWIEQAEALLDQAHASLKAEQMNVSLEWASRWFHAGMLSVMAKHLAEKIKAEAGN